MVEDLKIFQSGKQVFLKQVLKQNSGVQFPPIDHFHCHATKKKIN